MRHWIKNRVSVDAENLSKEIDTERSLKNFNLFVLKWKTIQRNPQERKVNMYIRNLERERERNSRERRSGIYF